MVGRPCSAAATAVKNATVTRSGSSRPVVRLMTALLLIASPRTGAPGVRTRVEVTLGAVRGRRREEFSLWIVRLEGAQKPVLHREQRGRRARARSDLRVDPFDVVARRSRCDAQFTGDLARGRGPGEQDE